VTFRDLLLVALLCAGSCALLGQEVRTIDLQSQIVDNTQPKTIGGSGNDIGRGGGSEGVVETPRALELRLTDVRRASTTSAAFYTLRVVNVSSESIPIPSITDLRKLYTPTNLTDAEFEFLSFYITRTDNERKQQLIPNSTLALYGRKNVSHTFIRLRPGAWVTLKGRVNLASELVANDMELQVHAVIETVKYRRTDAGLFFDSKELNGFDSNTLTLPH
jgi:hypothetical protein